MELALEIIIAGSGKQFCDSERLLVRQNVVGAECSCRPNRTESSLGMRHRLYKREMTSSGAVDGGLCTSGYARLYRPSPTKTTLRPASFCDKVHPFVVKDRHCATMMQITTKARP